MYSMIICEHEKIRNRYRKYVRPNKTIWRSLLNNGFNSVKSLLEAIHNDTSNWTRSGMALPWFRGHTNESYVLLPSILRSGNEIHEFNITNLFRLVSSGFYKTPETDRIDQWLFFMQHLQIPTRLLDWTESPLVAIFFAAIKALKPDFSSSVNAAVFAIDPIELNKESGIEYFPNTWAQSSVLQTIKFAFGTQNDPVNGNTIPYLENPVAIYPSTVHPRLKSQKGCFTLHGNDKRDIETIFRDKSIMESKRLRKYILNKESIPDIFKELNDLGITYSTIYSDLDGLAKELKYRFKIKD